MDDLFNLLNDAIRPEKRDRTDIVRAPFGFPGSKARSLDYLLPHLPYRKSFIDVCGGSGSVILARDPSPLEIFNDRWAGITCFYRVIRDSVKVKQLIDRLHTCLHSREEWMWCAETWNDCHDEIERAARWYYMLRMSFGQLGRNFGREITERNLTATRWADGLQDFDKVHRRMRNVTVENQDCRTILKDFDHVDAVFYVDPPYIGTCSGAYKHQFTVSDHRELCDTIHNCRGFVALSGYANDLYETYEWDERHEWSVFVSVGQTEGDGREHVKRGSATEVLWIKEAK